MTKRIDWKAELSRWADEPDPKMAEPYIHAFVHLRTAFGKPIGEGRHRIVFLGRGGHDVIKLPMNDWGESDNQAELTPDGWLGDMNRYARAWEDKALSKQTGLLVIRMEFVTEARGALPGWTGAVDCAQVGYTKDGRLVAYDFGRH